MLVFRGRLGRNIAVVELFGTIGGGVKSHVYDKVFSSIEKDDRARALVLDIDSPGGGVSASDYLYRSVLKVAAKKPVIASVRGLGASGSYYIACAAHKIIATPGAIIGSIGVISVRPALQDFLERHGVGVNVNKSGAHKDMGAFWRDATPEEQTKMQALIDESYDSFVSIVAKARKMDEGRYSPYEVASWIADTSVGGLSESRKGASSIEGDATVKDLLEAHGREGDPCRADLKDASSTRAWTLELSKAIKEEDDALAATLAVRLLARIAADSRVDADLPFGGCPAAPHIRAVYEVHLGAWIQRCRERSAEPVRDFLAEVVLEWVLFRHLRVATRKLAGQGVSTFKFRPEEGELIFVADEPTTPVFTSPRLRQAAQILGDLGFLTSEDRKVRISEDGQALLESFDD